MVRNVNCQIVKVPATHSRHNSRLQPPMDLLPWADPYIAQLVRNLESEAAEHDDSETSDDDSARRFTLGDVRLASQCRAEARPPFRDFDTDFPTTRRFRF